MTSNHDTTPAGRAYTKGTLISMAVYVVGIFAAAFAVRGELARTLIIILALVPGLAIVGQIAVTLNYLRRADEFLKAQVARRLIIACMGTLVIFTVWGFLDTFAGFQAPPAWATYCVMWALFGVISCVERLLA